MTNQEVKTKLEELQATFATGKFWNHTPGTPNNPDSVTTTACAHHIHDTLSTCDSSTGSCGCNFFGRGIQCHGFALYMAKKYLALILTLIALLVPQMVEIWEMAGNCILAHIVRP